MLLILFIGGVPFNGLMQNMTHFDLSGSEKITNAYIAYIVGYVFLLILTPFVLFFTKGNKSRGGTIFTCIILLLLASLTTFIIIINVDPEAGERFGNHASNGGITDSLLAVSVFIWAFFLLAIVVMAGIGVLLGAVGGGSSEQISGHFTPDAGGGGEHISGKFSSD